VFIDIYYKSFSIIQEVSAVIIGQLT